MSRIEWRVGLIAMIAVVLVACGCQQSRASRNLEIAQTFRAHVSAGRTGEARAMLAADPRVWTEERVGEGQPYDPEPGSGPWAAWDDHFRSQSEVIKWTSDATSATARVLEINDYYRLLERGPQEYAMTYFISAGGNVEGMLIKAGARRNPGRWNEFIGWAQANAPDEIAALRPGGRLDPRGDHALRFRVLLNRWRAEVGLPAIE